MDFSTILGIALRHGLTIAGGYVVSKGLVTADQFTQIAGAVTALAGVGLSVYQKRQAAKAA